MKNQYFILIIIAYFSTLVYELVPEGIYYDWFIGADIIYPDYEEWGHRAGKPAVSLQRFLHDLGDYFHVLLLYIYICINTRQKEIWFLLSVMFFISLLNYIYNYHKPFFGMIDTNYIIAFILVAYSMFKRKELWS